MRRGIAGLLLLAVMGCAAPPAPDPTTRVVVRVGERDYTMSELQQYFDRNLVTEDELDGAENAAVKSRLFDAFVEERLLLSEADRRGLEASDLEIEAYLGLHEGGELPVTRSNWEEAGRRVKIEKLLEAEVKDLPAGSAGDPVPPVPVRPDSGRRLRLRSLMFESTEVAERVARDIGRRRISFDEAVVAHAASPEQGLSTELSWDRLSDEQREVLKGLKRGQVSRPLATPGGAFLFQLEAWIEADPANPEADRVEAERVAAQVRRARAQRRLQSKLAKSIEISVFIDRLPFDYVVDDSVGGPPWNTVSEGAG